jgi:hypothetical protein
MWGGLGFGEQCRHVPTQDLDGQIGRPGVQRFLATRREIGIRAKRGLSCPTAAVLNHDHDQGQHHEE